MATMQSAGERLSSSEQRRIMVDRQIRTFDVTDQVVTTRMLDVPRELFVEPGQQALAYSDATLDLGGDAGPRSRSLLPPFVVARMLQAATPQRDERVLDVGGGAGYTAALLAGLVAHVVAVESDALLSARAAQNFATMGLTNAQALHAPLREGGKSHAPFDLIILNGCAQEGLADLAELLTPSGRLIAIVPKPSGATMVASVSGRGTDLSVRPMFDAQASVLQEFRRAPVFVL